MSNSTTPSLAQLRQAITIAEKIQRLETELQSLLEGGSPSGLVTDDSAPSPRKPRAGKKAAKRGMSEEGRRSIAEAQKRRWAAKRKEAKL